MDLKREKRLQYQMHKKHKQFGQILGAIKWYIWEEQTSISTDFAVETEENIEEDSKLKGS